MFYDSFVALCAANLKSPSAVGRELGIDKSTVSCWKRRKANPSDVNAKKIADYFGVSVEDLMGDNIRNEAEEKEAANTGDLSDAELKLIELFRKLPAETQSSFPALLEATLKAQGLL